MKKLEFFIEGSGLEIPPLVRDGEGHLCGGFIGIGDGATISVANNGCTNPLCTNNGCVNDGCSEANRGPNSKCVNNGCLNNNCTNDGCKFTTGTTQTSHAASTAFLSLLI